MGKFLCFSAIFEKGDNFHDFLFIFLRSWIMQPFRNIVYS